MHEHLRAAADVAQVRPGLDIRQVDAITQCFLFFFSSRRRHTRLQGDWSSDVCSSDLRPRFVLPDRRHDAGWSGGGGSCSAEAHAHVRCSQTANVSPCRAALGVAGHPDGEDRKSTRLNSSHLVISYAVFCLKKTNTTATASASTESAKTDILLSIRCSPSFKSR